MIKAHQQNGSNRDFLLKFWAFFLTASYCIGGTISVLIFVGALREDGDKSYLVQCSIGGAVFGLAGVAIVAYWGLLMRRSWARPALLIVAYPALVAFPIGTGFGIMVLFELRRGAHLRHVDNDHKPRVEGKQKKGK